MFDWIVSIIESGGYAGVFFLMFLENVFPPIPSEVIIPLSGFIAASGHLNGWGVLLAAALGSLLGAIFWYGIGRWFGIDRLKYFSRRYGRILTLSEEDIDKASLWFQRRGKSAILIGRVIPTVRSLISVPAGITRMPVAPFVLYSTVGTVVWTGALLLSGYLLQSQYAKVESFVNPVSNAVVAAIVGYYLYRVITFKKNVSPK